MTIEKKPEQSAETETPANPDASGTKPAPGPGHNDAPETDKLRRPGGSDAKRGSD